MKKTKKKYPSLWGCFVDEGYNKSYSRQYLQGVVNIHHYKGHMLLSVVVEPCKAKGCTCTSHPPDYAWMDGNDLDAMITFLRDAKKVWLGAYRKAERVIKRRDLKRKK